MSSCVDYGKRLEAWTKCNSCEAIENCSILSLEYMLRDSKKNIEVLTPSGRKLKL